jgi:4'-phosphopantetheinyl transferase
MTVVWEPAPAVATAPAAPDVHVWRAPLPERGRAASRIRLWEVLARYGADGAGIELGPHGKPALPGGPRFNASHTGTLLVVAVSADREVGVDVEAERPRENVLGLAERWLDADAAMALAYAPEAERQERFHRLWVRREAVGKCFGTGLGHPAPDGPVTVLDATLGPGLPCALAAAGDAPVAARWLDLG